MPAATTSSGSPSNARVPDFTTPSPTIVSMRRRSRAVTTAEPGEPNTRR